MRTGAGWDDACILNISSRGLLIRASAVLGRGHYVELRRGPYVIVARVIWRNGSQVGLHAQDRMPIEQIIAMTPAPRLPAAGERRTERRSTQQTHDRSREFGRAFEFISFGAIGLLAATAATALVADALMQPLAAVRTALDPH
jgi:hypothetical protein